MSPTLLSLLLAIPAAAQDPAEIRLVPLYRLDLRARAADDTNAGRALAVHVFRDRKAGLLFYVAADGKTLAVLPAGTVAAKPRDYAPRPLYRLTLPVREWGTKEFDRLVPKIQAAVFRDENTGNLIYVSRAETFAVAPGPKELADKPDKGVKWLDRLPLKVRRAGNFDFPTLRCNVEVYRDENTGHVVYVAESGALVVVALKQSGEGKPTREPEWSHGLEVRTRPFGEDKFVQQTPQVSAEVYRDTPRAVYVYLTDALRLAVVPAHKTVNQAKVEEMRWEGRVRPNEGAGEKWSAEVYCNPNTGDRLYVAPGGALAAVRTGESPRNP